MRAKDATVERVTIPGNICRATGKKWLAWKHEELNAVVCVVLRGRWDCGGVVLCLRSQSNGWRPSGPSSSAALFALHPGGKEGERASFATPRYCPEFPPFFQGSGRRSAFPRLSWALRPALERGRCGEHRGKPSRHSARSIAFMVSLGFGVRASNNVACCTASCCAAVRLVPSWAFPIPSRTAVDICATVMLRLLCAP